jgi:hypothetical protein
MAYPPPSVFLMSVICPVVLTELFLHCFPPRWPHDTVLPLMAIGGPARSCVVENVGKCSISQSIEHAPYLTPFWMFNRFRAFLNCFEPCFNENFDIQLELQELHYDPIHSPCSFSSQCSAGPASIFSLEVMPIFVIIGTWVVYSILSLLITFFLFDHCPFCRCSIVCVLFLFLVSQGCLFEIRFWFLSVVKTNR